MIMDLIIYREEITQDLLLVTCEGVQPGFSYFSCLINTGQLHL